MRRIHIANKIMLAAALCGSAGGCEQQAGEDPLAARVGFRCTDPTFNEDRIGENLQEPVYTLSLFPTECEREGTTSGCLGKVAQPIPESDPRWNHFCTCRCADANGNDHRVDETLCECPGDSVCAEVFKPVEGIPEDVQGSYCIPRCIAEDQCQQTCEPNSEDEAEWKWSCPAA